MKKTVYPKDYVKATEIPPGYLQTSRFTTPSIRTDAQRNALEAFEIAVVVKYDQFKKLCDRQLHFTSDSSWTGTITEYEEGYYVEVEGVRSKFQAFVRGDDVIRKPVKLGDKIHVYRFTGWDGLVNWMSS